MSRFTVVVERSNERRLAAVHCLKCGHTLLLIKGRVASITNSGISHWALPDDVQYQEVLCRACKAIMCILIQLEVSDTQDTFLYLYTNLIGINDFRPDKYDDQTQIISCSRCGSLLFKLGPRSTPNREIMPGKKSLVICHTCKTSYKVLFQ